MDTPISATYGVHQERIGVCVDTRFRVVPLAMAVAAENASPDVAFDTWGRPFVVSPSGKFIARLDRGENSDRQDPDLGGYGPLDHIATYRADRRPELYR